jgi:hypothetical protein
MRAGEPVGQLRGRLIRCFPVEGHHRDGDPWNPDNLGTPPIVSHERDFDVVRTPGDRDFEAV